MSYSAKKKGAFSQFHPVVTLSYFIFLLFLMMFSASFIIRVIAFLSGGILEIVYFEKKDYRKSFKLASLIIIISAVSNFIFISAGSTKLWEFSYFLFSRWHRVIFTWEAFVYGLSFGILLASLMIWLQISSYILSVEKVTHLTGRFFPKIALLMSLTLNFIPLNFARLGLLQEGQQLFKENHEEKLKTKFLWQQKLLLSLFSWALEAGIDTADSMASRGFGVSIRSSYSIFKWRRRDIIALISLVTFTCTIIYLEQVDMYQFYYYPKLRLKNLTAYSWLSYLPILGFFFLPLILELKEGIKWHFIQ